jgi:hypothetical protein
LDDLKGFHLLIIEAGPYEEAMHQSLDKIKKEGKPPILWIAAEEDRKRAGRCLVKPFNQEKLLGAVCDLLEVKMKALEERRALTSSAWSGEPPEAGGEDT